MLKMKFVAWGALTALAFTALVPVSATAQTLPAVACTQLLTQPQHGAQALAALGKNVAAVAALNGKTTQEFTALFQDQTYWVDQCGLGFYVEPTANTATGSTPDVSGVATFPYSSTFALHSKPGSNRTIYLDFNGQTITGTAWNGYVNKTSWTAPGYSQDADFTTFSNAEQDVIQSVWARVAEDYSAFDVDVTTEEPAADVLNRSSSTDQIYGARALISDDSGMQSKCGCGGIAYVGVFGQYGTGTSSHDYYQPAWIFTRGVGTGAKNITEAASHEIGHNLGLSHDGTSTLGYYEGAAGWAPIMGVGYYQPLTQWSDGAYPGANNKENDYSVMAANGAATRTDEDVNTATSARAVTVDNTLSGIITSRTDVDYVAFTPTQSGNYSFTATPANISPNLDIRLDVFDSSSPTATAIGTNDQPFVRVGTDTVSGLTSSISVALVANQTYYLRIDGVGYGVLSSGGYTDYGSIGQYSVAVAADNAFSISTSGTLPQGNLNETYNQQLAALGGTAPYSWSATGVPSGLSVSASGVLSGTPNATGTFTFNVTAQDAESRSVSKAFSLTVVNILPLSISTSSVPNASASVSYSTTLTAVGGTAPYAWSATGIPAGLSVSSSGVLSGTATTAGSYTLNVTVTDSLGIQVSKNVALTVQIAPLSISTSSLPVASRTKSYSVTLSASGGTAPYTWSVGSGSLPAGLSLSSSGVISGKATTRGNYSVGIRVTDSLSQTTTKTFTIKVQ